MTSKLDLRCADILVRLGQENRFLHVGIAATEAGVAGVDCVEPTRSQNTFIAAMPCWERCQVETSQYATHLDLLRSRVFISFLLAASLRASRHGVKCGDGSCVGDLSRSIVRGLEP